MTQRSTELHDMIQNYEEELCKERNAKLLSTDEKNERDDKLRKEIDRLREHLLESEQNHATEILEMENRIIDLKSKLAESQQTKESWDHLVNAERDLCRQLQAENEAIREEMQIIKLENATLSSKQKEDQQALQNLQSILRDFESCKHLFCHFR